MALQECQSPGLDDMQSRRHSARVCAVVPTHNSRPCLDECIGGLLEQEGVKLSVAVVDNASTDDSVEHVRRRWPRVEVVELRTNVGYGAAINIGVERLPHGHVLALNADAAPTASCLRRMIAVLDRDSRVGVVAPRLIDVQGATQPSAHRFPTLVRLLGEALLLDRLPGVGTFFDYHLRDYGYDHRLEIDWATGAALLIRDEAWFAVGGFDPAYFFFVEEIDLQRRLADLGWVVVLEPTAIVRHHGGKRPIRASLFVSSHDGFERYFDVRSGRVAAAVSRLVLCLTAVTRAVGWGAIACLDRRRRADARSWAMMFVRVVALSAPRVGRTHGRGEASKRPHKATRSSGR
jgi:N-acetylglucosaminyl-diphospho-decaprenol L-rhamnosyltransferase